MSRIFDYQAASMPSWWDGNYMMPWSEESLNRIQGDGAAQVVLVPTVYMDSLTSTRVYRDNGDPGSFNEDGAPRTESDGSIKVAVGKAKERGLEVILKMHVNMQNDDWNALIGPPPGSTPQQVAAWTNAWFASYKESVLHYARFAAENGVTTFAIGNECESMTGSQYREYWLDIIADVREIYSGKLTYAATWTEALHVSFWDKLDYIGANPYISFTDNDDPSVQQLIDGWTAPSIFDHVSAPIIERFEKNISAIDALKRIAKESGKKLIFTETGFRSLDGSNSEPWTWEDGQIDEVEQARMYEAFFRIITAESNKPWIGGYWLWNYDGGPLPPDSNNGYYTDGKLADAWVEQFMKATAVNNAPVNLALSAQSVREDVPVSTIVAELSAIDPDGDLLSYTLDTAGSPFRLDGNYVVLARKLDYETDKSYSLTITAHDSRGLSVSRAFTIEVLDAVETQDLTLVGTPMRDTLTGQAGNDLLFGLQDSDTLDGGTGNDRLYGGSGKDILTGGAGRDIFVFDSKPKKSNIDKISDFSVPDDTIHLAKSIFKMAGKKGVLKADAFYSGAVAHDETDRIIYDKAKKAIFYDSDGTGAAAQVQIASVSKKLNMTAKDFFIV